MKLAGGTEVDVYPVGLLDDLKMLRGRLRIRDGGHPGPWWSFLYHLRQGTVVRIKRGEWRAFRNYFNGYLAEHPDGRSNAGRGWTKRAAVRRLDRLRSRRGLS